MSLSRWGNLLKSTITGSNAALFRQSSVFSTQGRHFHFSLFKPSPFHLKSNALKGQKELHKGIGYEQLIGSSIDELDDHKVYRLGFSRKVAFNITHSSLAFLDEESKNAKKWLIIGRQSYYNLSPRTQGLEKWVNYLRLWEIRVTQVDNEQKYDLFKNSPFEVEMSAAQFSGAEIKKLARAADDLICKPQPYDAVHSNCYSATTFMLTQALELLDARNDASEKTNEDIQSLYVLLENAKKDNFSLGVANNKLIVAALTKAEQIIKTRNLVSTNHLTP